VTAALRLLLDGVFDYAGLFPPAALPMEDAAREYGDHVTGEESWIVEAFVCPVAWLPDLLAQPPRGTDPWSLSVLGTSIDGLRQDLRAIEAFATEGSGRFLVTGYEVKAGPAVPERGALKALAGAGFDLVYLELPWGETQAESLAAIAEADAPELGAKARTGGLEPSAFPSIEALAAFLQGCAQLEVPFKLTAGLHHPIRRHDPGVDAWMHGFLNVAIAGLLAYSHDLTRSEIAAILAETDAGAFVFEEESLGWGEHRAERDEVAAYRELFGSIGSCSIREPLDDLAELRLL